MASRSRASGPNASVPLGDEPLWFKDAIIYELHVRSFYDSDGDGIGDFRGLTEKLDYVQDLGVTVLWLLPFYPSPLRDDGYDIADYTGVNPSYGTLRDFQTFLNEAHRRGLRVITELVLNHTSDQHPWFQRARLAKPGSTHRDYYVWRDVPDDYPDARVIFKDFETSNWSLDPVVKQYYWHRFYHHQPDLNFDNPAVRRDLMRVLDFWMGMGVDGMRLDAVPYLYERNGTNCENLPETHAFLKEVRKRIDRKYSNRMLLAEANQWPEDAIAYFGEGDECHMAYHFPVMPRLFMALRMEDRFPIVDIMRQTPEIPENCQWAMFLRNHDELTLEMVTDEERDYMYRVYASDPQARINLGIRRRLAPLLGNNIRQIELMNALLFSMPGTPIIYYGDEIGMGDNVYLGDRFGVRTPMQWSGDRNAGFSRANPQKLYAPVIIDPLYHYEAVNVEAQQSNSQLLLWWMKYLISVRKQQHVFGRGNLEFLYPDNNRVLAFVRSYGEESVLVVANLSRFSQVAQIDLSAYAGKTPVEVFGSNAFPPITENPYPVTLSPYGFFWFNLKPQEAGVGATPGGLGDSHVPSLNIRGRWESLWDAQSRVMLAGVLLTYARGRRWFGAKARIVQSVSVADAISVPYKKSSAFLTLLHLEYNAGEPETYLLPVGFATGEHAETISQQHPQAVIAQVHPIRAAAGDAGIIYDALFDPHFAPALLEAIARKRTYQGGASAIVGSQTRAFSRLRGGPGQKLSAHVLAAEQSNTSVVFDQRLILKVFRRPGGARNPDWELGLHLTERSRFAHTPGVAGVIEYCPRRNAEPVTLALLHEYVENEGDAWRYTLDAIGSYFEVALARTDAPPPALPERHLLDLTPADIPNPVAEAMGPYLAMAALMGRRTAELHVALASGSSEPAFAPEPFSTIYQRSVYAAMRGQAVQILALLNRRLRNLPEGLRASAAQVAAMEPEIMRRFEAIRRRKINAMRIRCHGDYHLGQLLYTGRDFMIVDFEGEPGRPISERRLKRPPVRDVAGMLRSFDYAAHAALKGQGAWLLRTEDLPKLEPWARAWSRAASVVFLHDYLAVVQPAKLLPNNEADLKFLLDAYLLDKAVYEVGYELNNRPDWLEVPLGGILDLLASGAGTLD
ncbi:MAG: maltose alpha-D-glucosyltransferase [Dehalococcoidia bacterium]